MQRDYSLIVLINEYLDVKKISVNKYRVTPLYTSINRNITSEQIIQIILTYVFVFILKPLLLFSNNLRSLRQCQLETINQLEDILEDIISNLVFVRSNNLSYSLRDLYLSPLPFIQYQIPRFTRPSNRILEPYQPSNNYCK